MCGIEIEGAASSTSMDWRNAIAHQDFDPAKLGGATALRLGQVRRWRGACRGLARAFEDVMRRRLEALTGASAW